MENTTTRKKMFPPEDTFVRRHIGPREDEIRRMLERIGFDSLDRLGEAVVPESIQLGRRLNLGPERGEHELLGELGEMARKNAVHRSFIGMGYHDCVTPAVILRNVLENPGWYTQYTPYQSEISQGRLEALLNFQTMVSELTGLPLANASLLDEGTAAAEAMGICRAVDRGKRAGFLVSKDCHPQTQAIVEGRALPLGIDLQIGDPWEVDFGSADLFGVLLQYPDTHGRARDYAELVAAAQAAGTRVVVATDLLALTLLRPPGEFGADIAVGSSQRFGVPLGFGGPHAAFLSADEAYKRLLPGRLVGVSRDVAGRPALRLAIQTREQHIRRDKATSNICTAQVLLAVMAAMYAVYHGPRGLTAIARRVHGLTRTLATGLRRLGYSIGEGPWFDTLRVETEVANGRKIVERARQRGFNLRLHDDGAVGVSLDEATTDNELVTLLAAFDPKGREVALDEPGDAASTDVLGDQARQSDFLGQEVFGRYHSEHEMLRYLHRLQARDLSLTTSMIPLGSCTMKLNGTSQMLPISWPEFARLHPFAPADQAAGYLQLFRQLEEWLGEITGLPGVSLQPNAGAQGEYSGLLVIRAYHAARGEGSRDVCLIPTSAHGTNPASAVMAGYRVVLVECNGLGNIDVDDLQAKAEQHADRLAALMVTYPSTHGVFEESVREVCAVIHEHGGQVYMDGANMNAQVGLCRPAEIGADVCHLNLHKTFCIPHGGGGPGMGPIAVASHLQAYLPGHPLAAVGGDRAIHAVSAAPWGSAGILPISWFYIALMGETGLRKATQVAILNANYMASRLDDDYPVLYRGKNGLVAHEFILDLRPMKESAGVTVDDVAKRLMDFGLHAPTMSWPVAGTFMVEPTESESLDELDRFCDAMRIIREEIREIEEGRADRENNVLKRAPHTAESVIADDWDRPYSREKAAYPAEWVRRHKFWPAVGRVDNAHGDRNLVCSCAALDDYRRGAP